MLIIMSCCLSIALLSGCTSSASSEQEGNAEAVTVELATEPNTMEAGRAGKLVANVTGLAKQEGAQVTFELRRPDNKGLPEFIEAEADGDGRFTAEATPEVQGSYTVYIHLYQDELHVTKMKKLEVQ